MMNILSTITVSIVILLHVFFLILEMFLWTKPYGRKTFGLSESFAQETKSLAANQGLYNGFLAAGLLWGLVSTGGYDALIFFLSCIIIAGIYGAITAKKSILWIQAMPAVVAMACVILNM
jgi:putative membrane protein